MPPTKRRQSNAMLYTLIVFIGLFVVATTVAVIFYLKAEQLRTEKETAEQREQELVGDEYDSLDKSIAVRLPGKTYVGTLVTHLDQMVKLVKGEPVQPPRADLKVASVMRAVQPVLQDARTYIRLPVSEPNVADPNAIAVAAADPNALATASVDPNRVTLTAVISELVATLGHTIGERDALQQQLVDLRNRYDDAIASMEKTKAGLTARVEEYRQDVDRLKTEYDSLRARVERNADELVKNMTDQRDEARANADQLNTDLLRTQAELNVAANRLQDAMTSINEIKPPPDREAPAYEPDGKVILVDDATGVVRINLGANDRVYRGLTFSVYDKSIGITRDGKPKAEVEVFIVDPKVCAARMIASDKKNPVNTDDLVANLIWDADKENLFVIAGEFDLDRNGTPDYDAIGRIEALIRKWGGAVTEDVSATTDYVILGARPEVPPEPTMETLSVDPTATEKYNAARQRLERYEQIRDQARTLWIPIFSYERFLHFTGYSSQVRKPGAL